MGNCVCPCPWANLSTFRVVRHMGHMKRGGRMQRYCRQSHTFLAFSLRKYYFHLSSDNIVHQADTFPMRISKAIKVAVKNVRSRLRRNTCQCQTGATLHACVEGAGNPDLTMKYFLYGRAFLKSTESISSLFQREEAGFQHILSIKDHM